MRHLALFAALLATASSAHAQAPAALIACTRIMADAERLACFDGEMARSSPEARALAEKRTAEAAVAAKAKAEADAIAAKANAEAVAARKRDSFGAEAITSRADRFAPPEGELQTVETRISEVLTSAGGMAVFMLENGQIWRQVDPARLPRRAAAG